MNIFLYCAVLLCAGPSSLTNCKQLTRMVWSPESLAFIEIDAMKEGIVVHHLCGPNSEETRKWVNEELERILRRKQR